MNNLDSILDLKHQFASFIPFLATQVCLFVLDEKIEIDEIEHTNIETAEQIGFLSFAEFEFGK